MSTFDIDDWINDNYIFIDKDNKDTVPDNSYIMPGVGAHFPIPYEGANVSLQPDTLKERFYADMIKDMGVPYPGETSGLTSDQIIDILNTAFGDDSPFINEKKQPNNKGEDVYTVNANAYKSKVLQQRYNKVISDNKKQITEYRNILKTSTLAISGFSNAPYQFYESGLGIKKICSNRTDGCKSVDTATNKY